MRPTSDSRRSGKGSHDQLSPDSHGIPDRARDADGHGLEKDREYVDSNTLRTAVQLIEGAGIDGLGVTGIVATVALTSGMIRAGGEAIAGIVQLITEFDQFVDSMKQMADMLLNNPGMLTKLPQLMVQQVQSVQQSANPFFTGEAENGTYADSWYLGYVAGTLLVEIVIGLVSGGVASVIGRIARSSSRIRTALSALDTARTAVRAGTSMRIMSAAGTIRRALPDVDVDTGAVSRQLRGLPDGAQSRVLRNMRALSDDTKAALDATAVEAPAAKAAKIARYTGANGRRALNELASVGTAPVSRLLRTADDVATMRAMVRAWSRHDLETDELRTMLQRYRSMDADRRAEYSEVLKAGDSSVHRASARLDEDELNTVLGSDASLVRKTAVMRGVDEAGVDNLGDSVEVRQQTLRYLEGEGEGSAGILRTQVCWNPCEEFAEWREDFADSVVESDVVDDFDEDELDALTATMNAYNEQPPENARPPDEITSDLSDIAEDDTPGLHEAVTERTTSGEDGDLGQGALNNFKGLDGEAEAGNRLLQADPDGELALEQDVSGTTLDGDFRNTDVDAEFVTSDGEEVAVQVKKTDYGPEGSGIAAVDKQEISEVLEVYADNDYDRVVLATDTDPADTPDEFTEIAETIESSSYNGEVDIVPISDVE